MLFLGPGTAITHAAIGLLAEVDCLVEWVGEGCERFYASGAAERTSGNLLHQIRLWADAEAHLAMIHRMYAHRFGAPVSAGEGLEVLRGREGHRMRGAYALAARHHGVAWSGRSYRRAGWGATDPANRALSAASVALYAYCQAAILALGFSPAIGFIHTGSTRSLVFDIADLYKAELTIPLAFATVAAGTHDIERRVRRACRTAFDEANLGSRLVPTCGPFSPWKRMLRSSSRVSGMHLDVLIVVRLERVPERIRGDLSLWLLEIDAGMFVGDVSPEVRDHLWRRIVQGLPARAGAVLVHPARSPQRFGVLVAGDPNREVVDAEGLILIRRPPVDSTRHTTSAVDS